MINNAEALRVALAHHQAGQFREAETIYRQIIEADPNHAQASHLLGLVSHQLGRHDLAVELIRRAIALGGDQAVFYSNLAVVYRDLGRLGESQDCCRQALRLDPNLPDAHNNLGNVLRALGHAADAISAYRRAIALKRDFAEPYNNLGTMLQAQGDRAAAIAQYRQALQINPRYVDAYHNLGAALKEQGNLDAAVACYDEALRLAPQTSALHLNLGTVYQAQKRFDRAIACYHEALRLDPRCGVAHNNLGTALRGQGRMEEALASFREALVLDPDLAEAHFNLGSALHAREDWPAAAAAYHEALRLRPDYHEAATNLGNVMEHQQRLDEALAWYDRAIQLKPDFAMAYFNRANVHKLNKMPQAAIADFRSAIQLQPDYPEAYNNLAVLLNEMALPDQAVECCRRGLELEPGSAALFGNLAIGLQHQGRIDEAIAASRKAVELNPQGVAEYSNLLYTLNAHPDYDPPTLFAEHLAWAKRHAEPLTAIAPPHANDRTPGRRLRIGYVSPYFRTHAVNYFTEPILTSHDHSEFEIFCYSDARVADQATKRLKAAADQWRETRGLSDERLARLVRDDAIDILVDLTGHIAGSRLLAFARKPAPIQVTYIGYQNTTGMSAMDYRLTDVRADPPGVTDPFYTEQLVRLPRSYFCYQPADDPPVDALPALAAGYVTFGSFNNFFKITPQVIDTWLDILTRVGESRLLVLAYRGGYVEQYFQESARSRGIDPERIELCDKRPRDEYARLLQRADIGLDPFPFNGHTTTCDCLWLGVPVVMLEGQTYASRFGTSVLANVGLEHLIARSREEYVNLAVELAGDLDRLAALRAQLRPRMAESALLDHEGFTRNLERAYREMWLKWCGVKG